MMAESPEGCPLNQFSRGMHLELTNSSSNIVLPSSTTTKVKFHTELPSYIASGLVVLDQ